MSKDQGKIIDILNKNNGEQNAMTALFISQQTKVPKKDVNSFLYQNIDKNNDWGIIRKKEPINPVVDKKPLFYLEQRGSFNFILKEALLQLLPIGYTIDSDLFFTGLKEQFYNLTTNEEHRKKFTSSLCNAEGVPVWEKCYLIMPEILSKTETLSMTDNTIFLFDKNCVINIDIDSGMTFNAKDKLVTVKENNLNEFYIMNRYMRNHIVKSIEKYQVYQWDVTELNISSVQFVCDRFISIFEGYTIHVYHRNQVDLSKLEDFYNSMNIPVYIHNVVDL